MITEEPRSAEKTAAKAEKVRGMNASLAGEGAGPLRERDPGRLHITRRQIAFALALAVLGLLAAIYTVDSVTSGEKTYAAAVTTSEVYDLNFPNTGEVTALLVKVGQHVSPGQVLARQNTSAIQQQLSADEGVVKADQQAVSLAQAPQLSSAQREQDSLQVQQAQTAVTNAQAALSAAEASGKAAVAGAQAAVVSAQQLANSDKTRYSQACPNGPVPPASNLTGVQLQNAQNQYQVCLNLQLQWDKDASALAQAQAQVPVVESQSQQTINQAQETLNSAQAALNTANYQVTLQSSPTDPAALAQAEANLNQAQGQLVQIQQQMQQATLVATNGGVVAEVYGAVGEYLGPDGVHQYQAPAALPSSSSSGIQLFPTQTTPSGSSDTAGTEPLVEIVGGQQQVQAQVPESDVSGLPVGRQVTVSFSALGTSVTGVVTEVVLSPTRTNTAVTYDVVITLNHTVPGLLPGMSATVRS